MNIGRKPGFTLIELLIVVTILAILFAILLPTLYKARHKANLLNCLSNQRQIAISAIQYAAGNDNTFPTRGAMGHSYLRTDSIEGDGRFNDRPHMEKYFAMNETMNCPLQPNSVDLEQPRVARYRTGYFMFFGWAYKNSKQMSKSYDNWEAYNIEYDILTIDKYARGGSLTRDGHRMTSHQIRDSLVKLEPLTQNGTNVQSMWHDYNEWPSVGGRTDLNFTRKDGSAGTLLNVDYTSSEVDKVPLNWGYINNRWILVPTAK